MKGHAPGPKKDGSPWVDRNGNEWQRWWCGKDHLGDNHQCRVSIPQKTGRKVPRK